MSYKHNCKIKKNSKNTEGNPCDTELGFLRYETKTIIHERTYS